MLVLVKYSGEEGLGIRKIRDKRNKRRIPYSERKYIEEVNVRNEKSAMQGKILENN